MQILNPTKRTVLALAALAASVLAQEPAADPTAHHEQAKAAEARNPIAAPHLSRAMSLRGELGLDDSYSFQTIMANTDDTGGTHVRLQEYFQNVRVVNGTLISHMNAKGEYLEYTDALKKRVNISVRPGLTPDAALAAVTRTASLGSIPPKVELVVLPIMERIVAATGAPLDTAETSPPTTREKPAPSPDAILEAPAGALNTEDTLRTAKEYRLVYEIRTGEGTDGNFHGTQYRVDASTGEILSHRGTEQSANFWGQGKGKFTNGTVLFNTVDYSPGYRMYDSHRNYYTKDDDKTSSDPVNRDLDNIWGDGLDFVSDASATGANRQTAMVDGMFGSRVYWELMNNVFHRKGPNNNYYDVNVFVHVGTNWNDAYYSNGSGNISLGDGDSRQALDCLGHENGHGLNDFTANLGGSGENGGLNESNSDIWGAMTTFYLNGGAYATQGATIPASGGKWVSVCSGRNMQKPSNAKQRDYWWPAIDNADEHDAAAPNNRAFYFLSQGASAFMRLSDNSTLIPWGMTGLGTHKAASIWYDAFVNYLPGDADYAETRKAVIQAATQKYGAASTEVFAIQNAYAAINVGSKASNYPTMPPVVAEVEPNNLIQSAQQLKWLNAPRPVGAPDKLKILGGSFSSADWFQIEMMPGQMLTARLEAADDTDYDLKIYDFGYNLVGSSVNPMGKADQISVKIPSGFDPNTPQTYYIQVIPFYTTALTPTYRLYLDNL